MVINVGSLKNKFDTYIGSTSFKTKAGAASEGQAMLIVSEAGESLANSISQAIVSNLNSGGAVAAVGSVSVESPRKIGYGEYSIGVNIEQQFRPSLVPEKYGGVDDMAALFNNGYVAANPVFGIWHGRPTRSVTIRVGAGFVGKGVYNYLTTHTGDKYKILDIDISDRFE